MGILEHCVKAFSRAGFSRCIRSNRLRRGDFKLDRKLTVEVGGFITKIANIKSLIEKTCYRQIFVLKVATYLMSNVGQICSLQILDDFFFVIAAEVRYARNT